MKLDVIDGEKVLHLLGEEFRYSQPADAICIAFICEHIRAVVAVHTESVDDTPISRLRVQRTVAQRIKFLIGLSDDLRAVEDTVKSEIDHLIKLKDLVETSDGLMLAPMRVVQLDAENWLLVGGGPLQSLPKELRAVLQVAGRARLILNNPTLQSILMDLPWQRMEDWLSATETTPRAWGEAVKRMALKKLVPCNGIEQFEIMVNGYWRHSTRHQDAGELSLIRYRHFGIPGKQQYALAAITRSGNGEAKVSTIFSLEHNDARRLQGCLPINGRPPELNFMCRDTLVDLEVNHPLAKPESYFLSLGWIVFGKQPSGWPKHYQFPRQLMPLLKVATSTLGFSMTAVQSLRSNDEQH